MSGGEGWARIVDAQIALDVFSTGALTWWMARRLSGPIAAAIALGLTMLVPFTAVQVGAALTECLATALTVATVAALVLLRERPRTSFLVAGLCLGLSVLTRSDGLLAAIAFVPALYLLRGWRERAIGTALSVAAFGLVMAPWAARNLSQFGHSYLFGTRVNSAQQPVVNWQGAHHFMQSYGRDWRDFNHGSGCIFERYGCAPAVFAEAGAIDDAEVDRALRAVLARHAAEGLTAEVDRGYEGLARAAFSRHPLRAYLFQPAWRSFRMWTDPFEEVFQKPPPTSSVIRPMLPALAIVLPVLLVLGTVALLRQPGEWALKALLLAVVYGRTAALGYTFYCMPRYVREVMPLAYVVIGWGAAIAIERLRSGRTA
jgi:4-amino-4-deoxy-L-arabinose transferase-like glycosyltransferase